LQSVVQGDLAPGAPQVYTVRAGAGELIVGTFELRGSEPSLPVTVGLYDDSGRMVNAAAFWGSPLRIGFVTLTSGTYQIRIAAENTAGGTYTLRTERQTPAERMAGAAAVTPIVRFKSTRIDQLAKDVSTGQAGAVDRFWSEAEARGGPLVETIDGNDQYVLLTFLWKEMYETHNVLAIWPGPTSEDYHMSRVPGTNVWYKSVRVFHASRFSYQLAPNDRGDYLTAQRDPLNPLVGGDGESSVLEMPGAPDESWFRRTPPVRGTITQHRLDSVLLKATRDISVYTPPGYAPSNGPYALLVLFDGPGYVGMGAPSTLDNLIAAHRIRPTVVCFVRDNRSPRFPDQMPAYAAAMATELVPWLRSSYAVSTDPKDVVSGGYSAGGGMAGYVALNYPAVFGNVLSQSGGSLNLLPLYLDAPKVPVKFYIDSGLYEYGPTFSPNEPAFAENGIVRMRHFRDVLQAKGYDVTYRETGGAHQFTHWAATLAEGLIALLGQPAK